MILLTSLLLEICEYDDLSLLETTTLLTDCKEGVDIDDKFELKGN